MTDFHDANRVADLLWRRLKPNFPELNGMCVGKDTGGDWYIQGSLETQPTHNGEPATLPTEFMGYLVQWRVIGKLTAQRAE